MCKNLELYEQGRVVPDEACKTIPAGKLKGMTDINPMWRIKKLTEMFGPCGIGWVTRIIYKTVENGANGEAIAIVDVGFKYKLNGEWSEEIVCTGGSMLIATEKGKLVSSDEAFKMAYTDALSVCCKMLGICADIYFSKDRTKYYVGAEGNETPPPVPVKDTINVAQQKEIVAKWQDKHGEIKAEEDKVAYGMLLSAFGAKKTADIKIVDFEKVLEAIE